MHIKFNNTLIKSGGGTGPVKPGNRHIMCIGANSSDTSVSTDERLVNPILFRCRKRFFILFVTLLL